MLGLRSFNLVLVGPAFPIEQIDTDDFDFRGHRLQLAARIPQFIQARVNEYSLQILPDRFQVAADASKATGYRTETLVEAAKTFISEYTSKRTLTGVGHNFTGSLTPKASADILLKALALPPWFRQLIPGDEDPRLSHTSKFRLGDGYATFRFEVAGDDPLQVFYDVNVAWGVGTPLAMPKDVFEILDNYHASCSAVSDFIENLAKAEL